MKENDNQIKREAAEILSGSPETMEDPMQDIVEELSSMDPAETVRDLRFIYETLSQVDESIEEEKKNYCLYDTDREKLERLYSFKMDILYKLSFVFHPFSSYGRSCIERAVNTRKEFEELDEIMTTRIEADNIKVFMPVLTEDLAEDILNGRREALGAVRSKGRRIFGVGAIVYWLDEDTDTEDSSLLRIEWLYVHEDFRGQGIGDSLMGELVYQMQKNHIEAMTASFTVGSTWEEGLASLFTRWRFGFGAQMEPDTIINTGDVVDIDVLKKDAAPAVPLSEMEEKKRGGLLENVFNKSGYIGYLWDLTRSTDYFDPDASCYIGDSYSPDGVMLMHKTPSGDIRMEYVYAKEGKEECIFAMASFTIFRVLYKEKGVRNMIFPISMPEFGEYMEKVVPQQRSAFLITGVLTGIPEEYDVDEAMIEKMLTASDEEIDRSKAEMKKVLKEVAV